MHHYRSSEIQDTKAHIGALKEIVGEQPVVIMFDRNYASLEFVDFLEKSGVNYLIRLHKGHRCGAQTRKWNWLTPGRGWDI
jgi:hypothetical protein